MRFLRPKGLLAGFLTSARPRFGLWSEAGELWTAADWKIGSHVNEGWELFFQARGSSDWRVGRSMFTVPDGGYYLIAPRVRHELIRFRDKEAHFYFAVFRPDRLVPPITCCWPQPFSSGSRAHLLEPPFRGLMREIVLDDPDKEQGIACYLGALTLELNRLFMRRSRIEPELAAHPASLLAREIMDSRLGEPWRLEELAGLCGVSIPHLIAVFRKDFRATPKQYLLLRRLERAAEILRSSDRPVTEVALECGFSSSQHFAQAYRKCFGESPSEGRADRKKGSRQRDL